MKSMTETWRAVVGFEGFYEVSDLGRVRSLDRVSTQTTGRQRRLRGQVMSAKPHSTGYCFVTLFRPGEERKCRVHLLVLEAFRGSKPDGADGCHNDGDRANNKLDNLRYDTVSGNQMDRVPHGTSNRGEAHANSQLTRERVLRIRADGRSRSEVAQEHGISLMHVSQIRHRKRWAWL